MNHKPSYFTPEGVIPPQTAMMTSKVIVENAYSIIPASSITDNVRSNLPGWENTRAWVLSAPSMGHAAAFVQYLIYIDRDGGCARPEDEAGVESFLFVLDGELRLTMAGKENVLVRGGFAFIPAGTDWSVKNKSGDTVKFLWLRKLFEPSGDLKPAAIVGNENDIPVNYGIHTRQKWTTHLIPTKDMAYDMHMNIVSFGAGLNISFIEAHVMEHGLYMLEGHGLYLLNDRWHEVEAGDFIWMRSFCPQTFQASGETPSRYLLYKNMNRQIKLTPR
jgi:(S)-ureidoglycine aminohydrolase